MHQFVTKETYAGLCTEVEGSDYTPEEAKTIILKLLCDNRRLGKLLQKLRLSSRQQVKLVYVIEAVLFNHMAEEQLTHTNNVGDCLSKVKQYLNITKKFVEKTEILLQQYDFEGESEREQLYSSVREMGPISRICTRIQKKVDSKCSKRGSRSNGSLPTRRNGSVSSVVEDGENSGSTRRYRKRKMPASSNAYRRSPKNSKQYLQEESQDEQNEFSSNQQNHRAVPRSGLMKQRTKQRRRQKRVKNPETSDNESGRETENRVSTSEGEESVSDREEPVLPTCASEREESILANGEAFETASLSNGGSIETEMRLAIIPIRDILNDPAAECDPDVSKYKQKCMPPKDTSSKEDEEAYEVVDELIDDQAQESPDNNFSDKDNHMEISDQASSSPPQAQSDDMGEEDVNPDKAPSEDDEDPKSPNSAGVSDIEDAEMTSKIESQVHIVGKGPRTPPDPSAKGYKIGPRTPPGDGPPELPSDDRPNS